MNVKEYVPECLGLLIFIYIFLSFNIFNFLINFSLEIYMYKVNILYLLNCLIGFLDFFIPISWRYKIIIPIIT